MFRQSRRRGRCGIDRFRASVAFASGVTSWSSGRFTAAIAARLRALFAGGSDLSVVRRLAGAAFIIRIVAAFLAFVSQIVLARWLGGFEFGIYVYAWTWLLLIGGVSRPRARLGGAALHPRIYRT